ncbi:MAG TPA: tRNA glutamyl-Q(34) synthetase GluQRS [Acidimicrobiaceae bacterium]|nr:tRNA glutamyl-Q(34) synthetase GluQRS [Acidimicrobiaceae bacterium]
MVGRWAPSPTGHLHLGNLRTALLAWLFARSAGGRFVWRFEDLDAAVRPHYYDSQLNDVAALGLDWDGEPTRQSDDVGRYHAAVDDLAGRGLVYECFCSRRDVAAAAAAPHGELPEGAYPGTCRNLTAAAARRRRQDGRPPALRLRAGDARATVVDRLAGTRTGRVDDFVLRRGDGTPAYNLAVVVDDAAAGVNQVVRGDDLLASAPRQAHLATLLGVPAPAYAHVPLVVGPTGVRLAKRDGAITLADRRALGESPADVLEMLLGSLGPAVPAVPEGEPAAILARLAAHFDPDALPTGPWVP